MRTKAGSGPQMLLEAGLCLLASVLLAKWLGVPASSSGLLGAAVVLVAAQHGLVAGLLTGLVAAAYALCDGGPGLHQFVEISGDRQALVPAFGLVALVSEGYRRSARRLQAELAGWQERAVGLDANLQGVLAQKQQLERRLAREVLPVEAAAKAGAMLGELPPEAARAAVIDWVQRFLEAKSVGLYALDGERLRLVAGCGEVLGDRPLGAGWLARVLQSGRPEAALDPADHERAGAWLVAPVTGVDGATRGVLLVDELPFKYLSATSLALLGELASHLGNLVVNDRAEPADEGGAILNFPTAHERELNLPEAG
jgi:hypothetical protein